MKKKGEKENEILELRKSTKPLLRGDLNLLSKLAEFAFSNEFLLDLSLGSKSPAARVSITLHDNLKK